jgi:hypothetical protein
VDIRRAFQHQTDLCQTLEIFVQRCQLLGIYSLSKFDLLLGPRVVRFCGHDANLSSEDPDRALIGGGGGRWGDCKEKEMSKRRCGNVKKARGGYLGQGGDEGVDDGDDGDEWELELTFGRCHSRTRAEPRDSPLEAPGSSAKH